MLGVLGECEFARMFNLSVEPIYATISGLADFMYRGYRIEVKTYAAETRKPKKRCTLLVQVSDAQDAPCDFYVLWSVNTDNTSQRYPIGWATHFKLITSQMGVWSQKTGLLNYGVPRNELRHLRELDEYIVNLHVLSTLPDGRQMSVKWDTGHVLATIAIDGRTIDYVYRGTKNDKVRWFSVSHYDHDFENYKDAVAFCSRQATTDDALQLMVAAT